MYFKSFNILGSHLALPEIMKKLTLFLFIVLSFKLIGQSTYTQVTVFKKAGLNSSPLFSSDSKAIDFRLVQQVENMRDTSTYVAVSVQNVIEKKVGSTTGAGLNSNLEYSFNTSSFTQVYHNEGYVELSQKEFHEIYLFINSSMGKANPMQELPTAHILSVEGKIDISLVFDGKDWGFVFTLEGASYPVDFQDSIDIILELKEMDDYFNNHL